MKITPTIENTGYGISGDIGGLPRTTYFTPDGREIKAIPSIREYVKRDKDGKVIGNGTRDTNLDKGWLLTRPTILKLFCRWCDKWHDNQAEVKTCGLKNNKLFKQMGRKAKLEDKAHTSDLERQVAMLTAQVTKLMEGKNGHGDIFQSKADEGAQVPRKQRARKAEAAI